MGGREKGKQGRDVGAHQRGRGSWESEPRVQRGQLPHTGRALKISEVVLVAEYLILGSMCSRDGMSIFMGKPGRYRFPLLGGRTGWGQKNREQLESPAAHFPNSSPLSSPRLPRPPLTLGSSPVLSHQA